ncbi:MAG: hypothetical protein J6333_01540 [Planctomycetes bacterium]|nr:hypothetical protein [Planctomycetota bacterium]
MNKNKYTRLLAVAVAVALIGVGCIWWLGRRATMPAAALSPAAWAAQVEKLKQTPFRDLEVASETPGNVVSKYRIFKPPLDLLAIPNEPRDWEKAPFDSFLRFSYTLYCDPNPSYDKYSQSFLEGKKYLDEKFRKLSQFANDEKGFFKRLRANVASRRLFGEVVCDSVHMFIYITTSSNNEIHRGGVTMIDKDGKFYNDPEAKCKYKALMNMSADQYRDIFKHFPEYKPDDD